MTPPRWDPSRAKVTGAEQEPLVNHAAIFTGRGPAPVFEPHEGWSPRSGADFGEHLSDPGAGVSDAQSLIFHSKCMMVTPVQWGQLTLLDSQTRLVALDPSSPGLPVTAWVLAHLSPTSQANWDSWSPRGRPERWPGFSSYPHTYTC